MHLRQTRPANAVERNACSTRDYLPPPAGSTDEFAMTWDAIVRSFPPDFFRACDAAMLGQRVACELELRAVQKIVDDLPERYIPNGAGTLVPHPAIKDLETLRARLRVLCIQTRTSPGSRMDPNSAPKEPLRMGDSQSPLADLV